MMLTPSVADPVGSMLAAVPTTIRRREWLRDPSQLDNVAALCKHPALGIHKFPNGETSYHCQRCAKTWPSLQDAIDEAEQTEPIHATEGNAVIPQAISTLANEMSQRLEQTLNSVVDAVNPSYVNPSYEDFVNISDFQNLHYPSSVRERLRARTPFVRNPLPSPEGSQTQEFDATTQEVEELRARIRERQSLRQATQEATEAVARRNKAMEDAARSAAAAFDAGESDKDNPVNLDTGRRLKAIS